MSDGSARHGSRHAPVHMGGEEFRAVGHRLVEMLADFYDSLAQRPVTPGESPRAVRAALGGDGLPQSGRPAAELLEQVAPLLFDHSLHNGHPRFSAYITSSATPLGALADLLAAGVNPNIGRWDISPIASEIESQTVRWLAELIGYPAGCGGLMVSGGNMANLVGLLAARKARADWDIRADGLYGHPRRLIAYGSADTHTWLEKAADICGLGTRAIRLIDVDAQRRMRPDALRAAIAADRKAGHQPFLVVGTAGTTATGAIDPLPELAAIAKVERLWFHVDGAYGAPAACLPEAPAELRALGLADSVAVDPHKWLYSPLEAACTLVRDPAALTDAFSFHPSYYKLDLGEPGDAPGINYYNLGLQNSRGFRALKVWLGLRQAGRDGVATMIRDDIALARHLHSQVAAQPELEARTQSLSITTFRFVPADLVPGGHAVDAYLNQLNERLQEAIARSGEAFVSNAVVDGDYLLRACIVNFRTSREDMDALPGLALRLGRSLDAELRPAELR